MTTQQRTTIAQINAQLESDRFQAEQAAREVAELDAVSVFYAVQAKIEAGLVEEARALVVAWRASKRSN